MTNWGAEAANLNENFDKVSTAIEQVKNATIKCKGYFSSESALKLAIPTAAKGDKAYVGNNYPYQIWIWNGSSWGDSGSVGGEESVNLGDYHTKEYTDAKLSELSSKVFDTQNVLQIESTIETIEGQSQSGYINPDSGRLFLIESDKSVYYVPCEVGDVFDVTIPMTPSFGSTIAFSDAIESGKEMFAYNVNNVINSIEYRGLVKSYYNGFLIVCYMSSFGTPTIIKRNASSKRIDSLENELNNKATKEQLNTIDSYINGGNILVHPQPTKIIENARIRMEGHLLFDSYAQGCNVACYELEDNVEISYTIKNNPLSNGNAAVASYLTKEQCEYDQSDSVKNKAEHVYSLCASGQEIKEEGISTAGFSKYIRVSYKASEGLPILFYAKQVDGVNKKLEELGRKVDDLDVDKLNKEVFGSSEPVDVYPEPSLIVENKRLIGGATGGVPTDDTFAQGYNIACYILKKNMPISFTIKENGLSSNNVAVAAYATKEICENLSNDNRKLPSKVYALCNSGAVISGINVDTTDNPIYIRVSYKASEGLPNLYYTDTEGKKGLVNKVNDLESALPNMGKDVYMYNIPNELYVLKGVRQKIYYNQMIVGGESTHDNTITNIRCYVKFASGLTMSSADDEGFSILSYTEGDYSVEFSAYDLNMVEIVKKNILIHIVSANTSRKNILMTGASWVDINNGNKGYTAFLNMWSSSIGAELNFCGTKDAGTSGLKHEGHGGTTYNWFATNASSPFISEGSINVTKYRTEILGMNETFDAVYIQLGGNEATSNTNIVDESSFVKELWNYAEMIYDAILSDSPNCKIFAYIPALCSTGVTGFASLNKGTTSGVVGKIKRTYLIQKYLRYYIENTEKYKDKVFPCQDALGLSRWMGFGYKDMRYRYFKIGSSISSSDLQKIRQHDWSANYYMKAEGYTNEFLICGYDVRGYVLGLERHGTNWYNENQEFVNDWSEKSNDVPSKGTLVLSGGSIGKDFPNIPFDECVIENSELKKHVFDNGTHPCETGYRQLALALCNQVLSV